MLDNVLIQSPVFQGHPLNAELSAWYLNLPHLSLGNRVWDITGLHNHGTPSTQQIAGWRFDGQRKLGVNRTADMSTIQTISTGLTSNGIYTMSGWFSALGFGTGAFGFNTIMGFSNAGYSFVALDGSRNFSVWGNGTGEPGGSTIFTWPNTSEWQHLTVVRTGNSGSYIAYLNGISQGSLAAGSGFAFNAPFYFLGRGDSNINFDGYGTDFRLYLNRALSAADAWNLYSESCRYHPNTLNRVYRAAVKNQPSFSDATGSSSLTFGTSSVGAADAETLGQSYPGFFVIGTAGTYYDASGSSSLTFTVSSTADIITEATGSSSLTFTVLATVETTGETAGSSSLTFTVSATAETIAETVGSSGLTFTVSATTEAAAETVGSSGLTFTVLATAETIAETAGNSSLTFTAVATAESAPEATGSSGLTFTVSSIGASVFDALATSSLAFNASATVSTLADAAGDSVITFTVPSSVGSAYFDAVGLSGLSFSVSAQSGELVKSRRNLSNRVGTRTAI